MAVAINNSWIALDFIPQMQRQLDYVAGGGRRFQIYRVCAYATILPFDSELWRQLQSSNHFLQRCLAKQEALDWQADPDDDLDELEVLQHLHQQASTVAALSSVISRRDHNNAATTLSGSALSPSITARTQGRLLSSFHRYSSRQSLLLLPQKGYGFAGISGITAMTAFLPHVKVQHQMGILASFHHQSHDRVVWASSQTDDHFRFWQLQLDVVDLLSRRTHPSSHPGKIRRTTFNPFLQVSDSPVVEDTSRGDRPQKYNGVRSRPDRKTWVAEMKPHNHKNKQDFGNFKSEAEAAHAVDAAFHHYGRPNLLNFPDTSLKFLSTRPMAAAVLDEKAKVKFVREEAKLLLADIAAASASPRCRPSGQFRSLSEMSSPFRCSGSDEVNDVVSQPQQWMLLDSICDISTARVLTNLETLNSVQNAEQGWDWSKDSSTLVVPPNVVNPSAYKIQSMWLDSLIRSPPAPSYSRSPSPSHFQEEIAHALLEQQSI